MTNPAPTSKHTCRLAVHVYEVDAFGELSATALLQFLQQAASDASAAVGYDADWYARQGTVWVIRRTVLELFGAARCGDTLLVDTWVSDIRRVRSQRRYEIRDEKLGAPLARAVSDWVYVDLMRARPVQPPAELQAALMPGGVVAQERAHGDAGPRPDSAFRTERRVELAAIDSVAHVNNARYATYIEQDLWDALAAHGWSIDPRQPDARPRLTHLDLEYFEAAEYLDQIEGFVWVSDVGEGSFVSHHLLQRTGRRSLRARNRWRANAGALPAALHRALLGLHRG